MWLLRGLCTQMCERLHPGLTELAAIRCARPEKVVDHGRKLSGPLLWVGPAERVVDASDHDRPRHRASAACGDLGSQVAGEAVFMARHADTGRSRLAQGRQQEGPIREETATERGACAG